MLLYFCANLLTQKLAFRMSASPFPSLGLTDKRGPNYPLHVFFPSLFNLLPAFSPILAPVGLFQTSSSFILPLSCHTLSPPEVFSRATIYYFPLLSPLHLLFSFPGMFLPFSKPQSTQLLSGQILNSSSFNQ